ncbi:hypothetical protein pipiens_019581 [Culex pipiens pipiens]|uniref:Uncharacterized protein n=1 Tax=Culex pipiens pipiens TaxID=38569 RepID=A0ABD1DTL8_CULPP
MFRDENYNCLFVRIKSSEVQVRTRLQFGPRVAFYGRAITMFGVFRNGVHFLNRTTPMKPILELRVLSLLTISSCNISDKTLRGSNLCSLAWVLHRL